MKITYYWIGEDEYGSTIARADICNDHDKAIAGHTIAIDPSIIPYGTVVIIDGKEYTAEDCGSAVKGYVIDIYSDQPIKESYYTTVLIKG